MAIINGQNLAAFDGPLGVFISPLVVEVHLDQLQGLADAEHALVGFVSAGVVSRSAFCRLLGPRIKSASARRMN